ncbi:polyprenyl synthetase family protein [Dehalobacterium formicoaceticum]|uniref:polyprenyl synthetase family protein n=1 Tax=Dehalobacterium formicoaceticum TaxID=51515 RepID=UPI000B7CED0D|nr:farnesyl diphosphate synthase [Dehalobacterium formicoaceticum]
MNIDLYLKEKANLINQELDRLLPEAELKPQVLHQAMRYSIFAGGKRLRPVLFLATLDALEEPSEPYLPFACALELIHTYSLIHDDLPAMDNDDLRRGLPTSHKKFGEAQAILAGDALLTYAFKLMVSPKEKGASPEKLLTAIDEVTDGAGLKGMIVGQVLDIEAENKEIGLDELQTIHRNKTGALFAASIRSAAVLAGCNPEMLEKLTGYAENFGLAFQITDDILDVIGDTAKMGKPTGSDQEQKKITYPSFLGLERSQELARESVEKAVQYLIELPAGADPLRALARQVIDREN